MRGLHEIAADIRSWIAGEFPTVRFSTAGNSPQLINEIKAMSEAKLPAVVIVIDAGEVTESARKEVLNITLVLIDRFVAGSDDRALSVWRSLTLLRTLFPPDVTAINDVYYLQKTFYTASGDPRYACFALELEAHQGV